MSLDFESYLGVFRRNGGGVFAFQALNKVKCKRDRFSN